MAELSESDRSEARRVAAEALFDEGGTMGARTVGVGDVGDVKEFFCQHWDEIKKVLQFIADTVGGIVRWALKAIIAAGDFLHGRICRD